MTGATSRLHCGTAIGSVFAALGLIFSVQPVLGVNYYVSQTGHDEADGTLTNTAWRTIDRVNHARFQPGDRVLSFNASGSSFAEAICGFPPEDSGTGDSPVVIGVLRNRAGHDPPRRTTERRSPSENRRRHFHREY